MAETSERIAHGIAGFAARVYLRKPDQAELLKLKFPDLRSVWAGAWNEAAFRAGASRSFRLTTLNVEITNRCNLRCVYCPVNRSLARPRSDLSFDRFREILERSPTVRSLLPFQWGEPLLHPRVFDMIELAARRGIRTFLTTNGTLLDVERQERLLASGLTRLSISIDGNDAAHLATRGVELAPIRAAVAELVRRRDASGSRLRIDATMVVTAETEHTVDEFFRVWRPLVDRVQAIPRMIAAVDETRTAKCREPWRGLLVVLADGRVTTCCADSEGALDLGDVRNETPAEIWNGPRMRALRRAHACGKLPVTCARCTEYRHPAVSPRFR